jgi:fused signal recognition particle receptor
MRFKLGERLRKLFTPSAPADAFYDDLEDLLVEADIGGTTSAGLVSLLKKTVQQRRPSGTAGIELLLKEIMRPWLRSAVIPVQPPALTVCLICGVNGVGKTTSIGKLASYFRTHHGVRQVIFSAADTFRAAAGEQLSLLGERLDIKVIRQDQGADPGAVVFDSLESAKNRRADLLLIDTSGRMHNKEHLVKELSKIDKIVAGKLPPDGTYHKLLVLDATTGQNALRQAEAFHAAVGIDSVMLAKMDSTAKGGAVVAIGRELGLPFSFLGSGEKMSDLAPFEADAFLETLFEAS